MTAPVKDYYCPPALYDVIYSDCTGDIPFWVAQAKAGAPAGAGSGRVLELGCGTGRILIPSLEAGARIEGLDADPAMLEHCRAKLVRLGRTADLGAGDMRDFTRRHRYALIVIAFNSFLHNTTRADQIATLRCCREHLEPGGRLMFHIFHPDLHKLLEHDGTPRVVKTLPQPAGGSVRVTDAGRCDPVEQRIWITRVVEMLDPSGAVTATHEVPFDLRYVWKPETELLLAAAGFTRFEVQGGFEGPRAPAAGDNLVWTAWKD